jgi:hypothetical protein
MSDDETCCRYVSSRGLLKSCYVRSYSPKSSCPNDLLYLFDFISDQDNKYYNFVLSTKCRHVPIYVCSEALRSFITAILPNIHIPFILVTGDSDLSIYREAIHADEFNTLVESPFLRKWFAQNLLLPDCISQIMNIHSDRQRKDIILHNKLVQLPIGLDYHTVSNCPNHRWSTPEDVDTSPVGQELTMVRIMQKMQPFYERTIKIFSNAHLVYDRHGEREAAKKTIPPELVYAVSDFVPRTKTWNMMTEYAFVLSPYGNGMDCHRTWEALCLGAIPIIRGHVFDSMFEGLPVLIVDEWSQITNDLLVETVTRFKEKHISGMFNYNKLMLRYYTNMWT